MIQTRQTIFNTLQKLFKRLFKQGDLNPSAFKNTLYAVILNDMKEWEEYKGAKPLVEKILTEFLLCHPEFDIVRIKTDLFSYKNVNTPQSNSTWTRVFDLEVAKMFTPKAVDDDLKYFIVIEPDRTLRKYRIDEENSVIVPSEVTALKITFLMPKGYTKMVAWNQSFAGDKIDIISDTTHQDEFKFDIVRPLGEPVKFIFS